jgi:hypothetical protein
MMNTKLPIISIVPLGGNFERYVIEDQRQRVWDGSRFVKPVTPTTPLVYAGHNSAAIDAQGILKSSFPGVESVKYVVPIFVEVFSKEPLPVDDVAQYLSDSTRLVINSADHGNGPQSGLVLTRVEWGRIEQMREFPND